MKILQYIHEKNYGLPYCTRQMRDMTDLSYCRGLNNSSLGFLAFSLFRSLIIIALNTHSKMVKAAVYSIFLPHLVSSFISPTRRTHLPPPVVTGRERSTCIFSTNFPTLEQLSKDSFMKQVTYASEFVPLLLDENLQTDLTDMISAQLR